MNFLIDNAISPKVSEGLFIKRGKYIRINFESFASLRMTVRNPYGRTSFVHFDLFLFLKSDNYRVRYCPVRDYIFIENEIHLYQSPIGT